MKNKSKDDILINELITFIENLDVEKIINISYSQWEVINKGKMPYSTFTYRENEQQTKNNTVIIHGDEWIKSDKFKKEFYSILNAKSHLFSKDYITKTIQNAISLHIQLNKKEKTEYSNLLDYLNNKFKEKPKLYYVFIEIEGIILKKNQILKVGNCKIYKFNLNNVKKLIRYDQWPLEDKKAVLNYEKKKYLNNIYAEINIYANDKIAAIRNAKIYLNRIIDIINFVAGIHHNVNLASGNLRIPLFEQQSKFIYIDVYPDDESTPRTTKGTIKHNYDFRIQEMLKYKLANRTFKKVLMLMNENGNNNFTRRLLTSIQWIGKAMWEQNIEIAFLNYITSLESLLLPNDEGELSYRLSLYSAYILSNKKDTRIQIFNKLKTYYNIRSKIIHSGIYEIEDEDLESLRYYTTNILLNILFDNRRKFILSKNCDEFDEKLKKMVIA